MFQPNDQNSSYNNQFQFGAYTLEQVWSAIVSDYYDAGDMYNNQMMFDMWGNVISTFKSLFPGITLAISPANGAGFLQYDDGGHGLPSV